MSAPKEEFQLVDEKILKAEERVLRAKENLCKFLTERNSLLSICRLPNEVLGLIITLGVQEIRAGMRPDPFQSMPVSWLWSTHVCRHWRAVALECPAIWDTPDFTRPKLAREMLLRAKSTPLYVYAWISHSNNSLATVNVRKALQDMTHIAEIRIRFTVSSGARVVSGLVQPAPKLRSLHIINGQMGTSFKLPDNLLAAEAPRLREMSIQDCLLPWEHVSTTLSGLRSLCLHGGVYNRIPHSKLKAFLQALQTMQWLEELEIVDIFPYGESVTVKTITTLPRLTSVKVLGTPTGCISLLNGVTFSSKASVDVAVLVSDPGDCSKALPILPHLATITKDYIKSVCIDLTQNILHPRFVLKVFDEDLPDGPALNPSRFIFKLTEREGRRLSESGVYGFAKRTLEALPLSYLPAIHLALGDGLTAADYLHYFGSLTKLHTMSVEGSCAHVFVQAFCSSSIFPPGSSNIPFSSLQSIILRNIDFDRSWRPGKDTIEIVLLVSLRYRFSSGIPVQYLGIRECYNFDIDQRSELVEVVEEVDWDGRFIES
ncbi:hypothetical protein VNI00_018188 [Paramarasmius palmivorus]|uniref:F-box domain-containing protein n=1 Tax=Paramarasmius palmivorus TaxID=297713 RepID=A0AAW0B0K0_9AGAR